MSATTRPSRVGEVDGVSYHFVDVSEFERLVMHDAFLEWAQYGRNFYGTLRSEVSGRLAEGRDVMLEIDIQGARQVSRRYPESLMIFVSPPSLEDLERRLSARGDTSPEEITRRLEIASIEMAEAPGLFDHVVTNEDLEKAIEDVSAILDASGSESP